MTVSEAALADICQHPEDEVPRLIYADWLKEHDAWTWDIVQSHVLHHPQADGPRLLAAYWLDEHGETERADFIRVQIKLAKLEAQQDLWRTAAVAGYLGSPWHRRDVLRDRERQLLERHRNEWTNLVPSLVIDAWSLDEPMLPYVGGARCLYRRGFVEEVTLTSEDFVGGPCERCSGEELLRIDSVEAGRPTGTCPVCHGSVRTEGHARDLFRVAPLLRVTLSDREPWYPYPPEEDSCWWFRGCGPGASPEEPNALPADLFDLLLVEPQGRMGEEVKVFRGEDSQQAGDIAREALHAAALLWGRRQAWPCPRCRSNERRLYAVDIGREPCPLCHGTGHMVEEG